MKSRFFHVDKWRCKDGTPYPANWIETRWRGLAHELDIIRDAWGGPLRIISGYRTPAYNAKVKGAKLSQHVQGRAADLVPEDKDDILALHGLIYSLYKTGAIHIGGLGRYKHFIHVDTRAAEKLVRWTGGGAG